MTNSLSQNEGAKGGRAANTNSPRNGNLYRAVVLLNLPII